MLGRMRLEALSVKRSRITHSSPVRRGVETVGIEGIERVLPDELANLAIGEEGEDLFLKRLLDEDLLAYSYKNPVEETQGPILIAVDGSGSMAGHKEIWAKALAIATVLQAKKEKRKSHGIIFGASEKEIFEIDVNRLEDLATASFHMGTNFGPPLRWAQDKFNRTTTGGSLFHHRRDLQHRGREKSRLYSGEESAQEPNATAFSSARRPPKQSSNSRTKYFSLAAAPTPRDGGQILSEI